VKPFVLTYAEANTLYLAVFRHLGQSYLRMTELMDFLESWEKQGKLYDQRRTWNMSEKEVSALRLELARTGRKLDTDGSLARRADAFAGTP
jgi:hypothetical protein